MFYIEEYIYLGFRNKTIWVGYEYWMSGAFDFCIHGHHTRLCVNETYGHFCGRFRFDVRQMQRDKRVDDFIRVGPEYMRRVILEYPEN